MKKNMSKYQAIIFDLDGTLWDACESVAVGWNRGFKALEVPREINADDVRAVCGKVYVDCLTQLYPDFVSYQDQQHFLQTMNFYEKEAIVAGYGELYPDVIEVLTKLSTNFRLMIVSNCEHWYLENFLVNKTIADLIEDFESHGRTKLSKAENIIDIMQRNGITSALYVGDTQGDFDSAIKARADFAFAKYGFGTINSLPHFELNAIGELPRVLL